MEKLELINGAKIVNNIFKLNVNIRKILKWNWTNISIFEIFFYIIKYLFDEFLNWLILLNRSFNIS